MDDDLDRVQRCLFANTCAQELESMKLVVEDLIGFKKKLSFIVFAVQQLFGVLGERVAAPPFLLTCLVGSRDSSESDGVLQGRR